MPKVISRSPPWLSRSSPAHRLFNVKTPQDSEYQSSAGKLEAPALRTLAHRGSEVFVANDRTIQWADLASIKADWESTQDQSANNDDPLAGSQYKVLDLPCLAESILQLVLSPNQKLLAVVTKHTVHVGTLPDSKRLSEPDDGPLRLKWKMVGQNAHTLQARRLVSVLWHPLGVAGNTLVTITADAIVRVWELQMQSRYSAEEPTVALDIRKLDKAKSTTSNIAPAPLGMSEGFSADSAGMEIASACFGNTEAGIEFSWSSMTLWIAMTEGDVYALCPLLPAKWQAPSDMVAGLAAEGMAELDNQVDDAQRQWLEELESETPREAPRTNDFESQHWIYTRPKNVSTIPRLQGPYCINPGNLEGELTLADIHVISSRNLATESESATPGSTVSLVCLLTQLATVYICVDAKGTRGRWLPTQSAGKNKTDEDDPELLVLEALETFQRSDRNTSSLAGWPSLTQDVKNPYAIHVTHASGIWYVSAEQWVEKLATELDAESSSGSSFRLEVEAQSQKALRQQLIALPEQEEDQPSSPLVILDSDLGYVILTVYDGTAQAAVLDSPSISGLQDVAEVPHIKEEPIDEPSFTESLSFSSRAPYIPSKAFIGDLGQLRERLRKPVAATKLHQVTMTEQIRLSPAVLEMMANDHRLLSEETHKLGLAVSDLFARCNMMQAEFKNQIARVKEISNKVDSISDSYDNDGEASGVPQTIDGRVAAVQTRQTALTKRFDSLRAKTGNIGRPLSDKETYYINEVDKLAKGLGEDYVNDDDKENNTNGRSGSKTMKQGEYIRRVIKVRQLKGDFQQQVNDIVKENDTTSQNEDTHPPTSPTEETASLSALGGLRVPQDIRKQRLDVIEGLLQRESALVDAVQARLESLSID